MTNRQLSSKIYNKQTHSLSLNQTQANPLTSIKFMNHDVAIRTQYFLEWRLIALCFLCSIFSYFCLNPLFLFYIRNNFGEVITSREASFIYCFFYGSCIVSLVTWIFISRLPMWNMGVLAETDDDDDDEPQSSESAISQRIKIINFRRNSYEARINGYLLLLRWILYGFTIALYLMAVATNYYQALMSASVLGIFYPNLLITSGSVLIYSIDQLGSVKQANRFMAVLVVFGWVLLPLLTAVVAEYAGLWVPFICMGFMLSVCILYLMCFGASQTVCYASSKHNLKSNGYICLYIDKGSDHEYI